MKELNSQEPIAGRRTGFLAYSGEEMNKNEVMEACSNTVVDAICFIAMGELLQEDEDQKKIGMGLIHDLSIVREVLKKMSHTLVQSLFLFFMDRSWIIELYDLGDIYIY